MRWCGYRVYLNCQTDSSASVPAVHWSRADGRSPVLYRSNMASSLQFAVNTAQYFRPKPPSLKIEEEICRGAYGSVHLGELDGRPVAVKRIHRLLLEAARGQGDFEQVMTDFKRECQLLEKLDHPHVVDFQGAFYDETTDEPLLVMERMKENLREFLERNRNDLSQQKQLLICLEISRGLYY